MIRLIIIFGWAAFIYSAAPAPSPPLQEFSGTVTAFSCDNDWRNPMNPCGNFRNGESPFVATGISYACPLEFLNRRIEVEGYGVGTCRDTPATPWYGSEVHVDIYMTDYDAAIEWGVRKGLTVWLLN